ncbi:MIB2 [Bugula neritina]|uniref:MIB2 n=1 Tax=Bugula neritina TaxID=10212 RepID=A0A7J7JRE6_BUGNE|nr:MIB2 [Bugula neritina]
MQTAVYLSVVTMAAVTAAAGLSVGVRVVRGPDWKWSTQDDGEGHVGTVIEIGRPGSKTSPDKTVVVQWDSGNKTNYRVGYQGSYDLRLFDNAPAGVKHVDVVCDACNQQGIAGVKWSCVKCKDYDLCTPCYMAGKHDNNHPFLRFITANSKGVKVGKRQGSSTIEAKGIFPGAKVERGPAWEWGNQDEAGNPRAGGYLFVRFRHHGDGSPKNSTVKRRHSTATLPHPPRGDKKQNLRRYPSTQSLGRAQLKHECSSK